MARLRDPWGHLWVVRQLLEELSIEEIQRRRDELFAELPQFTSELTPKEGWTIESAPAAGQAPNASPAPGRYAARIHLVIGPVGAGKSTFALNLTERLAQTRAALRLTLDDWMVTLFRPDRPETGLLVWYRERTQRCIDQIWKLAQQLTARGDDVVLEIGLLQREERLRFYERVSEAGLALTLHVLDAARDVRRARVLERNVSQGSTFSMVVPPEIFELASDLWQAPDSEECAERDVHFLRTDAGGA
jgi:predicted kinase